MKKKFTKFATDEIKAYHQRNAEQSALGSKIVQNMNTKNAERSPSEIRRIGEKATLAVRLKKIPVKLPTLTFLKDDE